MLANKEETEPLPFVLPINTPEAMDELNEKLEKDENCMAAMVSFKKKHMKKVYDCVFFYT